MNCQHAQPELEDLIYGEVSESRARELQLHLAHCSQCRSVFAELEREGEAFARYRSQAAIEPTPQLWSAIQNRIRSESVSPSNSRIRGWIPTFFEGFSFESLLRPVVLRQAAVALALVIVTAVATSWLLTRNTGTTEQLATRRDPAALVSPTLPQPPAVGPRVTAERPVEKPSAMASEKPVMLVATAAKPRLETLSEKQLLEQQIARTEREYINTIKMLDRAIAKRKDSLDASAFAQYEASLALIDESIERSRAALRGRVGDPAAGQFLLAAYGRKVELMQEIALQ